MNLKYYKELFCNTSLFYCIKCIVTINNLIYYKDRLNYGGYSESICFEIQLLYYFTEAPKVVHSSQRVKEEMVKKLPGYTESMDVVDVANLYDKHWIAIKNSETKNSRYAEEPNILSKNPYAEVATVVKELLKRLKES